MGKFDKGAGEHEIILTKLKYSFAMKMATLICWSVVAVVIMLGVFFGDKSLIALVFVGAIAIILGIISFIGSFRGAMAV